MAEPFDVVVVAGNGMTFLASGSESATLARLRAHLRSSPAPRPNLGGMGYPANVLAPDERVVVHRHPHWKALIVPVAAVLLTTAGVTLLWWWVVAQDLDDTALTWIGVAAGAVWAILTVWSFVVPLVRWSTTHFVVTNRRVMFRTGVLTRTGIDIPMSRITSVQFRHNLVDRMLRTGTLVIESASDEPLEFDDIPDVERVHTLLYHEVDDALEPDER